jgi:hypothetical protein
MQIVEKDLELLKLIKTWPVLPEYIKLFIRTLVESCRTTMGKK